MRRPLFLLLYCSLALADVRYEIDLAQAASRTLTVTIDTECPAPACDFQMPVWNATYQVRDFAAYVSRFEASPPHRLVGPSLWRVSGAGERVRVRYQYFADSPGPFGCSASARHVFLNFAQILMYPVGKLREPMSVAFRNKPAAWKIALELPERDGAFHARHYDELVDSPAELSAFAEGSFSLAGKRLRVVVDAEPGDYDLARLEQTARQVAATATAIMQDVPFPGYTFFYHFRKNGGGGMEHANSTAIDGGAPCRDCSMAGVTAHEFFHLWNVKRIRPQSLEPVDYTRENITPSLWFSEGVTSTYANYIMLQAGLQDPPDFLKRLEADITRYERLPAHLTQSAEESSIAAWLERYPHYRRPARSISYYLKGELAGYLLDLAIRHYSANRAGLDDLMRRLNTDYARRGKFFEDTEALERLACELAGHDLQPFFDAVIRSAGPIDWNRYLGYAGYRPVSSVASKPSLGVETQRRAVVEELEPNGPAEKAGVQAGDRIVSLNGRRVERGLDQSFDALNLKPGARVSIEIERAGQTRTLQATPDFVPRTSYRIEEDRQAGPLEKQIRDSWLRK